MKKIYLTFDDGPSEFTLQVLKILKKLKVKTTFFFLGKNLQKRQDIAKLAKKEGHTIANHGWNHNPLTSRLGINFKEIQKTQDLIEKLSLTKQKQFRPPYGIIKNPMLINQLKKNGYELVMFDTVGNDWKKDITADEITENVTSKLFEGAIIVLHDGFGSHNKGDRSQTVKALPDIIEKARNLGYEFEASAKG